MSTVTHEQTINTALAEVLERYGREWRIRSEQVGGVFEGGGRPDILIEKPDGWPIVIEAGGIESQASGSRSASPVCAVGSHPPEERFMRRSP